MRRGLLFACGAIGAVAAVAAATGVAPAASSPSATASQAFVAGSPTAIACGGSVDTKVTLVGQSGTTGQSTDIVLVLDLSGSMDSPTSKFVDEKNAALATLAALDAADGTTDSTINGNAVGIVSYQGSASTPVAPIGSSYSTLVSDINGLATPSGSSPHSVGIDGASAALAASTDGYAKAMVLITDGQTTDEADLADATGSATNAKNAGDRIVPIGIGAAGDVSDSDLESWASDPSYYQSGTPGPINTTTLVSSLGAAVAVPASFTLTETLGSNFAPSLATATTGSVTTGTGSLQWTGTLGGGQSATLSFRSTRNGTDVFSATNETVSTLALVVTGGTATVTPPASSSIGVLPCGGTLLAQTTCTGATCTAAGSQSGETYSLNAGTPPAGTTVTLTGLGAAPPPAGACAGFTPSTRGVEFDISPLSTNATFKFVIPKASLGTKKWFQVDVCLGTNLKFTTAISSLSNLRPGAKLQSGGTLPGRYWGLLPSIPRYALIPGLGLVRGPYISSRATDAAGDAIVTFVVPYVPGSALFTTDGKPGYDPKRWAG